jgi:hypothetical protein
LRTSDAERTSGITYKAYESYSICQVPKIRISRLEAGIESGRDQAYFPQPDLDLVAEAREILGTKTTTETVHTALREAVRRKRLERLTERTFDHMPPGWLNELRRG